MLVELKNGDTYNGHLVNCDTWMNINLRDVICTSRVRTPLRPLACCHLSAGLVFPTRACVCLARLNYPVLRDLLACLVPACVVALPSCP